MNENGENEHVVKGADAWLARRLLEPAVTADFATLAELWRRTVITFECAPPEGLEDGFWMVKALRGAWGRRLMAASEQWHRAPPFGRPDPLAAFFGEHVRIGANHVPRPFVVAAGRRHGRVIIQLTLFGFADVWRDDAIETFIAALELGVSLSERGRLRRPWPVIDWHWHQEELLALPPARHVAFVHLETPTKVGGSRSARSSYADLVLGLAIRIKGLARWQGVRIDLDNRTLKSMTRGIRGAPSAPRPAAGYLKWSSASPERPTFVFGSLTPFFLENIPEELWPALVIGQTCSAGANTIFGFGKYTV